MSELVFLADEPNIEPSYLPVNLADIESAFR